jgi:hypothetical protein
LVICISAIRAIAVVNPPSAITACRTRNLAARNALAAAARSDAYVFDLSDNVGFSLSQPLQAIA